MKLTQLRFFHNSRILFLQLFLMFLPLVLSAQNPDKVLFTYQGGQASLTEFKNLFEESSPTVAEENQQDFLELFINYKLKLIEAKRLGLDTLPAYLSEVEGYKSQLVESFTQNPDLLPQLTKEAYERSLEEVRALNLLIMLPPNAKPEDTLAAYNKMQEALNRIKKGEDFTEIALAYSEPKVNAEQVDLGYFSALQMVYPFETAAYSTAVGSVSPIFKSRFGYHILKVVGRRPANGIVSVKQIQLLHGSNDSLEQIQKKKIQEIYGQLQSGVVFDTLAKKYSDDASSASRGGLMQSFGIGQVSDKAFQEAAFALQPGENSAPFESRFGWHILQMVKREPVGSFEDNKDLLGMRIQRDGRSALLNDAKYQWLEEKYKPETDKKQMDRLTAIHPQWILDSLNNETLIRFKNKTVHQQDLLNFHRNLFKNPRRATEMMQLPFHEYFKAFYREQLDLYHQWYLEQYDEAFQKVFNKFKDGLLVYNVMESEVWKKSRLDSVGLQNFYEANKEKFPVQTNDKGQTVWKTPALFSAYQDYYEKQWLMGLRKKYRLSIAADARKYLN